MGSKLIPKTDQRNDPDLRNLSRIGQYLDYNVVRSQLLRVWFHQLLESTGTQNQAPILFYTQSWFTSFSQGRVSFPSLTQIKPTTFPPN